MESYKHSCPYCGQHIEYTAGYCGQQMDCPICRKAVTFPAVPPGGFKQALHIKREGPVRTAKWSFNLNDILAALREFEHWNIVLACCVPFGIVAALLIGAAVVRKTAGEGPDAPVAPVVQADANAWKKMTALARAEQLVQQQLSAVIQSRAAAIAAQQNLDNLDRAHSHASALDQAANNSVAMQRRSCEQSVANAQKIVETARQSFDQAMQKYQQLGGTVDYRQQLPPR